MPIYTIWKFLKFGQEKNIQDMYNNGTIYMNSIQYFREIEDNELRGDMYEGITRILNLQQGQVEMPSTGFKSDFSTFQLRQSYKTVLGNIFSLYCVSSHGLTGELKDFKIDEKNKRFGSCCLMINDINEFILRIENRLKELKIQYHYNFIEYYDKDRIDGEVCLFEKPLEFEYQKEFRFYVIRQSDKPFVFNIGSLTDIAEIYSSSIVIDTLELK